MTDEKQENNENREEELTDKEKQKLLAQIQRSVLYTKGSRHSHMRKVRRWFRTWSPKAKSRKRARRKMVYASRSYNRQRAKTK